MNLDERLALAIITSRHPEVCGALIHYLEPVEPCWLAPGHTGECLPPGTGIYLALMQESLRMP